MARLVNGSSEHAINEAFAFVLYCFGILVLTAAGYVIRAATLFKYEAETDRIWKQESDGDEEAEL